MGNNLLVVDRASRGTSLSLAGGGVLVVLAMGLPFWGESSWMHDAVELSCYLIFAVMWNLLAGYVARNTCRRFAMFRCLCRGGAPTAR